MQRGELSYAKVRALTRVACPKTENTLLQYALHGTAAHVERIVRDFRRCKEAEELGREAQQHASRQLKWYYDEDGMLVIKARLQDWRRVILVGGQALTAWVEFYKLKLPAFDGPYLTADADFLGTKAEAKVIAEYLKGKTQSPTIDDHTPNTAIIEFTGEQGSMLLIDMLTGVLGVSNSDAEKLTTTRSCTRMSRTPPRGFSGRGGADVH